MNNDSYSKTFGDGRIMIFNSLYIKIKVKYDELPLI